MSDSGSIERGGVTLAYETWGEGESVVLVHGFGTDREIMRGLAQALGQGERGYRIVLLDLRGHGASGSPADSRGFGELNDELAYGYPVQCQDLLALLDALAIDRAHWVGHSMGGQLALMAALRAPERTRSLVAIAAGPNRAIVDEREQRAWARAAERFAGMSGSELCAALDAAAPRAESLDRVSLASADDAPSQLYGRARGEELARIVRGAFLSMRGNADACRLLSRPALVIAGERDGQWLGPARQLAELLPGAEFCEVSDAGHLVHVERSDEVAGLIRRFLLGQELEST